ncbi:Progestin and adipoQ receptor family member 3 [Tupaia chinensis]|uniref:Progestin and adipoQ receptor family member 3 n=1 Tax=Tupaia chinensis TaxID=246437 RepID=L9KN83_TUPCH|nr:Progestin and adipoQ receptor family member 3 [Tupaia chinensis]
MAVQALREILPLFDQVLAERSAVETVSKGGIILPEKSQGKVLQATGIAIESGSKGKGGKKQPYWRQVYLITVLAMILAVFFAQIHPNYLTQQWQRLRSIIFCSVSGYGVIPTLHWIWLNGGIGAPIVQDFAPRVIVMYMIAVLAFLFYISKVPERYFPGQLNYLGSSHQIWHILAVVMLYWWHQSTVYVMQYRHSKPCPDYVSHL